MGLYPSITSLPRSRIIAVSSSKIARLHNRAAREKQICSTMFNLKEFCELFIVFYFLKISYFLSTPNLNHQVELCREGLKNFFFLRYEPEGFKSYFREYQIYTYV